jgi:hypothetical protein
MYDREDGNGLPNQTNMSRRSRSRPPQYNARNCGYDCGYGCTKDEGGGADTDAETAVGEEENGPSDTETQNHDSRESEDSVSLASSTTAASDGMGLQLSWFQEESEGMSASMVVEPNSSGNHSPVPTSGSPRSLSPIPWVFTIPVASPYYFLQTPLRLSPQYEDCRGDPASHLVVPDRSRLSYMMEQLAREYAPAYRNVSPPSFGAY